MTALRWLRSPWLWCIVMVAAVSLFVAIQYRNNSTPDVTDADNTGPNAIGAPATPPAAKTPETATPDQPQTPAQKSHPLDSFLQEASKARDALKDVEDYTADFTKRERIGGKLVVSTMKMKVRHEPFSVYLKFVDPKANAGRQVVYVNGLNDGNLLVQEPGIKSLLGIQPLKPTGSLAMSDNRHPITRIGLQKMLDGVIAQWESNRSHDDIQTRIESEAKLPSGEVCTVYESKVPTPREGVQFHITRLWIDQKTQIAIRLEELGFPAQEDDQAPVIEDYTYSKLTTNAGLSDTNFDAKRAFQKK